MLVVIDLQESYRDEFIRQIKDFKWIIKNIRKRILAAQIKKEIIVRLDNDRDGQTIPEIRELIRNYPRAYYLIKEKWDGSGELLNFIKRNNINEPIELTGSFVNVCVLLTWQGLRENGIKVLPVRRDLVLHAPSAMKVIDSYPEGYIGECLEER